MDGAGHAAHTVTVVTEETCRATKRRKKFDFSNEVLL